MMRGTVAETKTISKELLEGELDELDIRMLAESMRERLVERYNISCVIEERALYEHEVRMVTLARAAGNTVSEERLILELGSFLGECIVNSLGGMWLFEEGEWIIGIGSTKVYPFRRVRNRLSRGGSDSLTYFFRVLKRTLHKAAGQAQIAPILEGDAPQVLVRKDSK